MVMFCGKNVVEGRGSLPTQLLLLLMPVVFVTGVTTAVSVAVGRFFVVVVPPFLVPPFLGAFLRLHNEIFEVLAVYYA